MSLLSIIATVERIDTRGLEKAILESAIVKQGVIDKAREVQAYWKEYEAPVSSRAGHPLQKGSSLWDHPGDYQRSIKIKYHMTIPFSATVFTKDPKAHWLEYGSIHNPEKGYAARVVSHFNGNQTGTGKPMSREIGVV
jgi:hypothetical protein